MSTCDCPKQDRYANCCVAKAFERMLELERKRSDRLKATIEESERYRGEMAKVVRLPCTTVFCCECGETLTNGHVCIYTCTINGHMGSMIYCRRCLGITKTKAVETSDGTALPSKGIGDDDFIRNTIMACVCALASLLVYFALTEKKSPAPAPVTIPMGKTTVPNTSFWREDSPWAEKKKD